MNWVGGSRNRLMVKNDARKQREFFEKRKMQQKLRNMGIAPPESPGATGAGSMDLVTLFIVNQIAAKKDNRVPPKVAALGSGKRRSSKTNQPLVLPMSPCSPSQLSLAEGPPQHSDQGTRRRGHVIPRGFRCQQLSPVLESAFSDISAPDYLPLVADPLSPFSSTSSASSGPGLFPQKMNPGQRQTQLPPRCSPPPWDVSGQEQIMFQPFSQPRDMTDNMPWSRRSNPLCYQLETLTAAHALFGGPEPHETAVRNPDRHQVSFAFNQPEDKEPVLDFMMNSSATDRQCEVNVFRGFSDEEYEREAIGRTTSKIYLRVGTPIKSSTPQTVPDPPCVGMELSNCSDIDFPRPGHNTGPMSGCGYAPGHSSRGDDLSSDSNDDEECCRLCLQLSASSSHMEPASALRVHQKGMETAARRDETAGSRDAGTQTAPAPETRDASTQCSLVSDGESAPRPATGRQTDTAGGAGSGGKHTPRRSERKPKAGSPSPSGAVSTFAATGREGGEPPQRRARHFLDAPSAPGGKGEEGGDGRGRVIRVLTDDAREAAASAPSVSRPPEEVETLQEIADILLLLKQRKKEE